MVLRLERMWQQGLTPAVSGVLIDMSHLFAQLKVYCAGHQSCIEHVTCSWVLNEGRKGTSVLTFERAVRL